MLLQYFPVFAMTNDISFVSSFWSKLAKNKNDSNLFSSTMSGPWKTVLNSIQVAVVMSNSSSTWGSKKSSKDGILVCSQWPRVKLPPSPLKQNMHMEQPVHLLKSPEVQRLFLKLNSLVLRAKTFLKKETSLLSNGFSRRARATTIPM